MKISLYNYIQYIACICLLMVNFVLSTSPVHGQASGVLNPNDTVVRLSTSLDNKVLCNNKAEVYLYIDLKGCTLGKRVPLNLSVVFDRSGSMEGDRIRYGKIALEHLIDNLDSKDKLSIVMYDHTAEVLHGSEPVSNKEHLKRKVHNIHPRGSTNISAGLQKGYDEVKSTYDDKSINKVFLMSDGLANEGITDGYLLERMVKACSTNNNISLTAFGLGHEFDEVLMHNLAEAGGGHYYYIESPQEAANEFGREIQTLLSVVGQNAGLSIEFPSEYLDLSKVYGQHSTLYNNTVYIDLKEIHPNETNGILLKFNIKKEITTPIVFNTSLVYYNVITNTRTRQIKTNTLTPSNNKDSCDKGFDDNVLEKIVYFTSNDLLEDAILDADNNRIESAKIKLKKGKSVIENSKEAQSTMLQKQYKIIDDYDKHLSNIHKKSESEIRHLHKKTRHQNYKLRKMHRD